MAGRFSGRHAHSGPKGPDLIEAAFGGTVVEPTANFFDESNMPRHSIYQLSARSIGIIGVFSDCSGWLDNRPSRQPRREPTRERRFDAVLACSQ